MSLGVECYKQESLANAREVRDSLGIVRNSLNRPPLRIA